MATNAANISLHDKLSTQIEMGVEFPPVPDYILSNLKEEFDLRPYQIDAIKRQLYWWENKTRTSNTFLFHMATGSGKTLIMAALILEMYKKGFRNFLFFVHLDNILRKTRNNFLDPSDYKYLFSKSIIIDGKRIQINEVDNFEESDDKNINIMFSTNHGIHGKLKNNKENSISFETFRESKVVLISDEAHHLNAQTKNNSITSFTEDSISWEGTVNRIYNSNKENVLFEFTATAELSNPKVFNKYKDVMVFDYPLKKFTEDKFCKDIQTIEFSTEDTFNRALQALIISQYRLKLFHMNNINIKPVVMFKSNYANKPKKMGPHVVISEQFQEEFHKRLNELNSEHLQKIRAASNLAILEKAFTFFDEIGVAYENLSLELKNDFSREKCLCVNTTNESVNHQEEVNNLENNEYRAVFAVDKLNEGWDVLNLFDIVRLYNTTPGKTQKPGKTTMQEAQLIGRGARYCPFVLDEMSKDKRKFDSDLDNGNRILETLYYHCQTNPKYIEELRTALRKIGILADNSVEKLLEFKPSFKSSELYNKGVFYVNEREKVNKTKITTIPKQVQEKRFKVTLMSMTSTQSAIFNDNSISVEATIKKLEDSFGDVFDIRHGTALKTINRSLSDFSGTVVRTAIDKNKFYEFRNLLRYFPNLTSIDSFINSQDYLASVNIDVSGSSDMISKITIDDKLFICSEVLSQVAESIEKVDTKYKGSSDFIAKPIKEFFVEKRMKFNITSSNGEGVAQSAAVRPDLYLDVPNQKWYAYKENYGTDQEKYLVRFVNDYIEKLEEEFDSVYLVRNERFFGIYSFENGSRTEPDYLLFLSKDNGIMSTALQLFVEPKGGHLIELDSWKERFLTEIENSHEDIIRIDNLEMKLIGMPFYNEELRKDTFQTKFEELL